MRAIGIILAGGNNNRMRELANKFSNRVIQSIDIEHFIERIIK